VLGFSIECVEKYVKFSNNITTYCVEKRMEGPIDMI
jgi:hypothetical protein